MADICRRCRWRVTYAPACFAPEIPNLSSLGLSVRPRLGVQLVLWAFVLPGRPRCAPDRETQTEARQRVHLAGGVGRGGRRLADGCGAGVLGQWRQHSQQAPRGLTGHGAVVVIPRVAAIVTTAPSIDIMSSSAGMATISFDFSATFTRPSTMRWRAAKAETMWIASFEPLF